jgi:hypothetical protein
VIYCQSIAKSRLAMGRDGRRKNGEIEEVSSGTRNTTGEKYVDFSDRNHCAGADTPALGTTACARRKHIGSLLGNNEEWFFT